MYCPGRCQEPRVCTLRTPLIPHTTSPFGYSIHRPTLLMRPDPAVCVGCQVVGFVWRQKIIISVLGKRILVGLCCFFYFVLYQCCFLSYLAGRRAWRLFFRGYFPLFFDNRSPQLLGYIRRPDCKSIRLACRPKCIGLVVSCRRRGAD